jgi:hypothetical protein
MTRDDVRPRSFPILANRKNYGIRRHVLSGVISSLVRGGREVTRGWCRHPNSQLVISRECEVGIDNCRDSCVGGVVVQARSRAKGPVGQVRSRLDQRRPRLSGVVRSQNGAFMKGGQHGTVRFSMSSQK